MSVVLMVPRVDSGPAGDACTLHSCRRKIREAGEAAEGKPSLSATGKRRDKPFEARPAPYVQPAIYGISMDDHRAVSEFAVAARTGDCERALALPLNSTSACVASHFSYRTR